MILVVNLLFFAAISVINFFYQKNDFAFSLKCVASIGFVLMGLINVLYIFKKKNINKRFCCLMLAGFILAMLGDIIIVYNFIAGAAIFAMGHVFFILAYNSLKKYCKTDICISTILFALGGGFLMFCPWLDFSSPVLKVVCIVYAVIISNMLGKALGNFLSMKKSYLAAMALGSGLFFFSDLMLCISKFSDSSILTDYLCMGTYYPALCVLAFAICLYGQKQNNN